MGLKSRHLSNMASKTNYTYPLPPADLHRRYDPVFTKFKKGLCCTLIGLPLSARSGYLKFILEYDKKFLSQFIDPDVYHFIVLENTLTAESLIHTLAIKLLDTKLLDPASQSQLENRLKINDMHLTLASIETAIKSLRNKKIVLVLYEAENILDDNPTSISVLLRLWNIDRNQPNAKVHLCFIGSPRLLEKKQKNVWAPLRPALEESTINFPLFNASEMSYLRHRLEYLSQTKIPSLIHQLASQLSGGHTVLYRVLSQLSIEELGNIKHTHSHPAIDNILNTTWNGLSSLDKQNGNFPIPLLPPSINNSEAVSNGLILPKLTAQQKLVFDYLYNHPQQVISRDDIASVIWGKTWQEKYSDWAIDRCMSLLKKRLKPTSFNIITLRNRGYQLNSSQ